MNSTSSRQRSKNKSVNLKLYKNKFLEMFGLLGMESTSYICERMFSCIDRAKNGWISLLEYMEYMDVLMHGTEKEKLKQSFSLLDIRARGKVTYKDFVEVAMNVTRMWSAAYGKPVEMDEKVIKKVFYEISRNKKYFKSKDYVNLVRNNPDLMSWLTKPKELMDDKLERNISAKDQCYSSEMIEELLNGSNKFVENVISSIEKIFKLMKGQRETMKKRSRSFTVHEPNLDPKKEPSLMLHNICQKEFIVSNEKEKKVEKSVKTFIPGVERRKLKKKTDVSKSMISDDISVIRNTPTPEIFRMKDEEEEDMDMEGGEAEQESGRSSHPEPDAEPKPKKRKKRRGSRKHVYNEINQSQHSIRNTENSLEVDSEECKSDIGILKEKKAPPASKKLFKEDINNSEEIEDIPMSVFESSNSSSSDDSFESMSNEEYLEKLKKDNQQIIIEKFSQEEEEGANAAENIMVSLSDIPVEIDDELLDVRQNGMSQKDANNGRAFNNKKSEYGIRLEPDDSVGEFQTDNDYIERSATNLPLPQHIKLIDDIKSVHHIDMEDFKNEVYVEASLRDLEKQMKDSTTGQYDGSKLMPFLREYMTSENRVKEVKLVLEELLEDAKGYQEKLKGMVSKEEAKNIEEEFNGKLIRKTVKANIPTGKGKNKVTKSKRRSQAVRTMNMVHPGHENFNLVFNIMLGIKKAIDSVIMFPMFELQKKDFKIKCHYEIAPWRTSENDDLKACVFFDYAPQVFDSIRKKFNVEREEYSKSLGPDQILANLLTGDFSSLSELCSSGKSGSFFYYTADGKYMLKTISKTEFRFFKRILKNYYYHIERNDNTLVTRIYGLHKMTFLRKNRKSERKLYFCIMNNVFHTTKEIHKRYDLKGSTQGRSTKYANNIFDPTIALKDNDITDAGEYFIVTPENCEKLKEQIKKDVQFFRENKIIDYSLLIGIHDKNEDPNKGKNYCSKSSLITDSDVVTVTARDYTQAASLPFYEQEEGGVGNFSKQKIYFLGIIDILTEYNTKKRMEHFFKRLKWGNSISCVPPDMYASRFDDFICSRIITPGEFKAIIPTLDTPPDRREVEDINKFERNQLLVNDDMDSISLAEEEPRERHKKDKKKKKKRDKEKEKKKRKINNLDEEEEDSKRNQ